MKRFAPTLFAALGVLIVLAGCTTVQQSFPGHEPEHVWATLIAVAESPEYPGPDPEFRWTVDENRVWVDQVNRRIEVYRKVERILHRPRSRPLRQDRTWRFQIIFDPAEPPTATFVSRGFSIPRQAEWEGIHLFDDVRAILGPPTGAPARPESEPVELMQQEDESAAGGEPADTPPQSPPPPVDVEDLQPPA